jgi:hypothetical protein
MTHNSPGLEFKIIQSGITLLAPFRPESKLHSLPPILGSTISNSIPSCSKAPRGLFVLLQVDGIFTVIAISPSSSLRQLPSRYAFNAGQNFNSFDRFRENSDYIFILPKTLRSSAFLYFLFPYPFIS